VNEKEVCYMAAQEERLSQVELNLSLFKTETVKAYGDMAVELTLVKGLAIKAIEQLVSVQMTLNEHTKRLDSIDSRLDRMDSHFDHIETMLSQILARFPEKS
jgi:hypothetical protein